MITSSANARVKQIIQWQSKAKERRKAKVFLAEGIKMFEEAPEERILEVYLSQEMEAKIKGTFNEGHEIKEKLKRTGYEVVASELFVKMSDTQTPQGILTVLKQPEYELEEMLSCENPLLVVLENLQDPGNLGTILRTGEGAGITGVIMSNNTVDIFNPKTIRATMGSIYRVPFLYVEDLKATLQKLQEHGIHTYAAHLEGEQYYDGVSFCEPTAFIIGNEGNGLTRDIADKADSYLKIPMEGQVESLNAAVATALLMYEAHRQRNIGK
ncbi:MAG: RNA methyltransferase [Lachnospiraceae bacterium]|nr:RNA methyltransferase [Lachnospiraceae bacterium]